MADQKATNVHWHEGDITREHREKILGHKGATLWFTGLSGSGKSTIAVELEGMLNELGMLSYRLDIMVAIRIARNRCATASGS